MTQQVCVSVRHLQYLTVKASSFGLENVQVKQYHVLSVLMCGAAVTQGG